MTVCVAGELHRIFHTLVLFGKFGHCHLDFVLNVNVFSGCEWYGIV